MNLKSLVNMINTTTPYAWDDSLGVYEFLGKVVTKLNEVVDEVNLKLPDDFMSTIYEKFGEYTKEEMQRILDSGEFAAILDSMILEFLPVKQEVIEARQGEVSLGTNITKVKSFLADTVTLATAHGVDNTGLDTSEAMIALFSTGNKRVHFPDGLYRITKEIPLMSDTIITCSPNAIFYDPNYRTTKHRFFTATNKTNVHINGGKFYGNNSSYAIKADGFANQADGYSNGVAILFKNVTFSSIQNVQTKYMWESIILNSCADCKVDFCKVEQANTTFTEGGIQLGACAHSHVKNCHVINGGDGALFIYNGSHCSIKDCKLENTGEHINANCGMETCDHCTIENVHVMGAWVGFTIIESVRSGSVLNCLAEGCNTGYMISPYGIGLAGSDIELSGCRAIKMVDHPLIGYPVCGFYIQYSGVSTNYMSTRIKLHNCYFGRSNKGKALVTNIPTGVICNEITVSNCIFESSGYWHKDMLLYNTKESLMKLVGLEHTTFIGCHFALRFDSDLSAAQIEITRCKFMKFIGCSFLAGAANNQMSISSDSVGVALIGNSFNKSFTGGSYVLSIQGSGHIINDNYFSGSGKVMSLMNLSKSMISGNNAPDAPADTSFIESLASVTTTKIRNNNGYSTDI